ncbi:MAG: sigma-70 family RNA polymerase sigma factor [Planctomycetales bacterium]|nr:sigma-70 family RNA polymerase sigma factor [Planctomycetales bacterium]
MRLAAHLLSWNADVNDDSQIIQRVLAGERSAFGLLVSRYQDRLYNTLFHVVGSAEDARDLVQDAFVQALVKLDTFRGTSAFYTWLYRIAFNQAMSLKRREKPVESIEFARQQVGREPIDGSDRPDEPMMRQERVDLVRSALAALGEEHRTILVLREIDGCCYETISEILNLPIGTVRSRLHRARTQLRDELKEVLQEELG